EIYDPAGKLVRQYVSGARRPEKHAALPIADRWIPMPVVLENAAGAHRFVWDLRWATAGSAAELDEEDGRAAPRGPRAVPGEYQVKLIGDGFTLTQPLRVEMDPRAQATSAQLNEQLRLGLEIFGKATSARKSLAEMNRVKKWLANIDPAKLKQSSE